MASKPRFFNGAEFKIHILKQSVDISVHKAKKILPTQIPPCLLYKGRQVNVIPSD